MVVEYNPNASWRDTARQPRLGIFNVRALPPMTVALFHLTYWTVGMTILSVVLLQLMEYYGFTLPVFLRTLRSRFAGKRRIATPWWM
jgi:intracellular multiplication protein IcmT